MSYTRRLEYILESTSTVYMSGNAVYNLHAYGKPGIIARVELSAEQAQNFLEGIEEYVWDRIAEESFNMSTDESM